MIPSPTTSLHEIVETYDRELKLYKTLKKLWRTNGILYKYLHDKYEVKTVSSDDWGEEIL